MISFKQVVKEIPKGILLDEISFTLGNKEKVGLIGQNGCGKSTMLKMILKEEDYDGGLIQIQDETIGYLPQLFSFPEGKSVHDYGVSIVNSKHNVFKFEKQLSLLGLEERHYETQLESLSSGQQMRVKLAELLMDNPTVLILDEPTNHLDIDGIIWMQNFVNSFDGIVLMVSHDRSFLDHTVTHIFEIDEKKLNIFAGNYSDYIAQKQHWVEERKNISSTGTKAAAARKINRKCSQDQRRKSRGKAVRSAKKTHGT